MPRYEYRCRTCDQRFDVQRAMSDAAASAPCPEGHVDTVRVLSMFATIGTGRAAGRSPSTVGGGCCGGSCGCAH